MKKMILVAYDLNPKWGSEPAKAHNWLKILTNHFFVEVFVREVNRENIERFDYGQNVRFNFVRADDFLSKTYQKLKLYNFGNSRFIKKLKPLLIQKTATGEYSSIHYITPASILSYNSLYKEIGLPFIVGPLGGGLKTPKHFRKAFNTTELFKNYIRIGFYTLLKRKSSFRRFLSNAKAILIGTEYLLDYIPKSAKSKIHIVFDTVIDLTEFENIRQEKKHEYTQIVFSGHLSAIKGISLLIDAIKKLKDTNSEVICRMKVIILGDGTLRRKTEKRIKKYGLTNSISLIGRVGREQALQYLKESDIFCLPTIRENGGLAILEAMACGLPVITSNYGGPKFSINEKCGIKIEVENYKQYVNDLADALEKLIRDENLRKKMGLYARERVRQKFSLQALERKILQIYNGILI